MNETWPFKDIDSHPTKGRFFPISFAEATRAANNWLAKDRYGKRVRICLLNQDDSSTSCLLFAEYRPEEAVILYSWPEEILPSAAKQAVLKSFPIFAPLKRVLVPDGRMNFVGCYLLRLLRNGQLRLTKCKIHFQPGKYSGGQSFASAFKKRVTRVEETELPVPTDMEVNLDHVVLA
jgi:hypothetical protein